MTALLGQRSRRLVVASVPADHAYIRHLGPEDGSAPCRLPDPVPPGTESHEQRWWPPVMLDPRWVETEAERHGVDLVHVHFGFDARTPQELGDFVAALDSRGIPLVLTVHDLRNPHQPDRRTHDAALDVLVPAAAALVTLTPGAAQEIRRRWGRDPVVIPHPHVVELDEMGLAAARRGARHTEVFRVGLHVKSVRASMDPVAVLPVLVDTVAGLPGAVLQVNAHRELVDTDGRAHDPVVAEALDEVARHPHVDLRVHDYLADDRAFHAYLEGLDVSVLPYRFGTHSGWLEACRDVGTTVVAPTCGYYAEQGPVLSFTMDEEQLDATSLAQAVTFAYDERPPLHATVAERRRQRAEVAADHDAVYRSVIEGA